MKRLTKTGNSWAVVIDRPLLELTQIDEKTPLEISSDGDVIVISPVRKGRRKAKFKAAVEEINRRYAGVFRRLAE